MDVPSPARPSRRPQAERSAETRAKLIGAAIACLHRIGYSATTVSTVAAEAGVSRGAMTHHFAAKNDLMLAVVEDAFQKDADFYYRVIAETDPKRFLIELPERMWGLISRPAGIAVIEIMLGSRSDPEFAEKLRALQTSIDTRAHEWSKARIRAAGFEPHPESAAMHELYVAAVRGLALEATFMNNTDGVQRSLAILSDLFCRFYPGLDDPGASPS